MCLPLPIVRCFVYFLQSLFEWLSLSMVLVVLFCLETRLSTAAVVVVVVVYFLGPRGAGARGTFARKKHRHNQLVRPLGALSLSFCRSQTRTAAVIEHLSYWPFRLWFPLSRVDGANAGAFGPTDNRPEAKTKTAAAKIVACLACDQFGVCLRLRPAAAAAPASLEASVLLGLHCLAPAGSWRAKWLFGWRQKVGCPLEAGTINITHVHFRCRLVQGKCEQSSAEEEPAGPAAIVLVSYRARARCHSIRSSPPPPPVWLECNKRRRRLRSHAHTAAGA